MYQSPQNSQHSWMLWSSQPSARQGGALIPVANWKLRNREDMWLALHHTGSLWWSREFLQGLSGGLTQVSNSQTTLSVAELNFVVRSHLLAHCSQDNFAIGFSGPGCGCLWDRVPPCITLLEVGVCVIHWRTHPWCRCLCAGSGSEQRIQASLNIEDVVSRSKY